MWIIAFFVLFTIIVLLYVFSPSKGRGYSSLDSAWSEPSIVESIITPEECGYIMSTADQRFTRSSVVGVTGADESRTSETAWISRDDPVAQKILKVACKITGKDFENCEDLQVVRYKPGTYYRAHHDSCCDDSDSCISFESSGGQRIATLLVYLNDGFTDGETHFPSFNNIKIKANPGSAIFFRPLSDDDSKCHPKALHAGLPISTGVKYVCNVWVREGKFK